MFVSGDKIGDTLTRFDNKGPTFLIKDFKTIQLSSEVWYDNLDQGLKQAHSGAAVKNQFVAI